MPILIGLTVLCAAGIYFVFRLLKSEEESESTPLPGSEPESLSLTENLKNEPQEAPPPPDAEEQNPKSSILSKLAFLKKKPAEPIDTLSKPKPSLSSLKDTFKKFNFGKKDQKADHVPETAPLPSLKEYLESEKKEATNAGEGESTTPAENSLTGTAAVKTSPVEEPVQKEALSKEEEKKIEDEINQSTELDELKEKYARLDALFSEKSSEFESAKESLDNELKNRKEFNKVKDLLEKELKGSKDKARDLQTDLGSGQTESESHKKRITQLEEKSAQLEKDLLEKNDKIDELVKRLQTFASPTTAATPPTVEQAKEEEKVETAPTPTSPPEESTTEAQPEQAPESPQEQSEPPESQNPEQLPDENPAAQEAPPQDNNTEPTTQEALSQDDSKESERGEQTAPIELSPFPEPSVLQPEESNPIPEEAEPTQMDGPQSAESETPDKQPQEEQFLKLQPDVLSKEQEPSEKNSITAEIEQSLKTPQQQPEESPDSDRPSLPSLDTSDEERSQPSQENEAPENAKPEEQPEKNQKSDPQDNSNDIKKE